MNINCRRSLSLELFQTLRRIARVWFAIIFLASAHMVGAGPAYTIIDLGEGTPVGINDMGQIAGNDANGAFIQTNGVRTRIGKVGGVSNSADATWTYATAINNSGQVVGKSLLVGSEGVGAYRAFLYANGTISDLGVNPPPASSWINHAEANGMNDVGDIVGSYTSLITGQNQAYLLRGGVLA